MITPSISNEQARKTNYTQKKTKVHKFLGISSGAIPLHEKITMITLKVQCHNYIN